MSTTLTQDELVEQLQKLNPEVQIVGHHSSIIKLDKHPKDLKYPPDYHFDSQQGLIAKIDSTNIFCDCYVAVRPNLSCWK